MTFVSTKRKALCIYFKDVHVILNDVFTSKLYCDQDFAPFTLLNRIYFNARNIRVEKDLANARAYPIVI